MMALPHTSAFAIEFVELARFFKALAHPARVQILSVLAREGTCMCGDLVDELPLAQATVSQHLKTLKEAGLIQGEIEGPAVCYCLAYDYLKRMRETADAYFTVIDADCCRQ